MKKILLVIIILSFASSISFADDRTGKPYNYGYAKRHGMVAITGNLTDRISNAWGELAPGGGGFVYYNILNDFWGNFSIGLSADYIGGDFTTKKQNIKGKAHMAPVALNLAYMTSSNIVNAWIGVGVSYNFATFNISGGTNNGVSYGDFTQNSQLLAFDAFAGVEYLFTKDGRWGAFFEFRYTYAQNPKFNLDLTGIGSVSDSLDMQQLKYTIGFSYHF